MDEKRKAILAKYREEHTRWQPTYNRREAEKILIAASRLGLKPTTYIKNVSLNYRSKLLPPEPKIHLETKVQLRRIGVNINQIAKALQNTNSPRLSIQNELNELKTLLVAIIERLDNPSR